MKAPGTKACAKCGAPVADMALGRGAIEDPDGRRFCSPCAALLLKSNQPEARGVKSVTVRAVRPTSVILNAPAARKASSTKVPLPGKSAPASAQPPARQRPPTAVPAPSARSVKNEPEEIKVVDEPVARGETKTSRRVSRRMSTRSRRTRLGLGRGQLIGLIVGVAVLLILGTVGIVGACGSSKKKGQGQGAAVDKPTRARMLINEANRLYSEGKRDEALKRLREAVNDATEAGRDDLAVEANRLIYGINKSTPVNAH